MSKHSYSIFFLCIDKLKTSAFLSILFSIIAFSCGRNEEVCPYNVQASPTDSSLFISFEIEGHAFKYYQFGTYPGASGVSLRTNSMENLTAYSHDLSFGEFEPEEEKHYYANVILHFNNFTRGESNASPSFPSLSEEIELDYDFLCPGNIELSDTVFMKGVSIVFSGYSTQNVMSHFNYDLNLIDSYYNGESYFRITSRKVVCKNFMQLKGEFSTRVIYYESPFYTRNIENGEFCFLLYLR